MRLQKKTSHTYGPITIRHASQSLNDAYKHYPFLYIQILVNHISYSQMPQNIVGVQHCVNITKTDALDYLKPITFKSSKFSDTQCNYAVLVWEAFPIYTSGKRVNLY